MGKHHVGLVQLGMLPLGKEAESMYWLRQMRQILDLPLQELEQHWEVTLLFPFRVSAAEAQELMIWVERHVTTRVVDQQQSLHTGN